MARTSKYKDCREGVLLMIHKASRTHGKAPTVRDLADHFEVGVATMHSYLHKLAEEGVVEWRPGRHRSLSFTPQGSQEVSELATR